MDEQYDRYADSRLAGDFAEMSSWNLVFPYIRSKKALDIGCADGLYLQYLSNDSQGIEQVPALAEAGKSRGLNIVCGDVVESVVQIPASEFEAVLFSHVMEHVDSPISALREIQRVLQPGGTLVLGLPTERNIFRDLLRMDYYDGTHLYAFSVRNATKLLHETGFSVERVIYHLPKLRGRLGLAMVRLWNLARWPFREYLSMAYWIVATKS